MSEITTGIIEEIEKSILAEVAQEETPEKEPEKEIINIDTTNREEGTEKKRMTKKQRLIEDIIMLKNELGEEYSENKLKKSKIIFLEEELEELYKRTMEKVTEEPEILKENEAYEQVTREEKEHPAVLMLYNVNLTCAMLLEKVSETHEEKLGGKLVDYSKQIESNKKELLQILAQIYRENQQLLDQCTNPWFAYMFFMVGSGAMSFQRTEKNKTIDI